MTEKLLLWYIACMHKLKYALTFLEQYATYWAGPMGWAGKPNGKSGHACMVCSPNIRGRPHIALSASGQFTSHIL